MNPTPRTAPPTISAILSAAALGLLLTACTTTPAADTQGTTQTSTSQATDAAQASESDPTEDAQATDEPTAVVQTSFPGLEAPEGEPELESITDARPEPGEVIQVEGPFDPRFVIEDLSFDGSTVSGEVLVTSDISELLALQVLAGFYDADGNLLGTNRFDHDPGHEHDHGSGGEPEAFEITVPAEFADQAVSAAVGVPVLVNE